MKSVRFLLLFLLLAIPTSAAAITTTAPPYQFGFPATEIHSVDFASPSVIDLDGDGTLEVLTAGDNGCVWAYNHLGNIVNGFPLTTAGSCTKTPRINGPLAIGDVDGDGRPEIAAGTRGISESVGQRGKTFLWNHDGTLVYGWPIEMDWNTATSGSFPEVMTVAMANLVGDWRLEILAGTTNNASTGGDSEIDQPNNGFAWRVNGSLLPGYPTYHKTSGIFGLIGAADLTGDGYDELLVPRDQLYLNAYDGAGQNPTNWPVRTYVDETKTTWGTDLYQEYTRSSISSADLDNDGILEIISLGKVRDPKKSHANIGNGVIVLQPDGSRHPNWPLILYGGPPLYESFTTSLSPALADINNDNKIEIITNHTDGYIRAYHINGSLLWSYNYAQGHILLASEPVIGDITGDGNLNVVFGVYSPNYSANNRAGIYALDASGNPVPGYPLTLTHEGSSQKQGIRAAPTLADLDKDGDIEILAASWAGSLYVWDLPAAYTPSLVPWPTARQNNSRTGYLPPRRPDNLDFQTFLPVLITH